MTILQNTNISGIAKKQNLHISELVQLIFDLNIKTERFSIKIAPKHIIFDYSWDKKETNKLFRLVCLFWLLRTVMMHPVFGISYFVRLGAFRDMPHFVRRDIFACAKGILRLWRSGILFAHTTAVGNSTRRSRISLRSNRTRVRRE